MEQEKPNIPLPSNWEEYVTRKEFEAKRARGLVESIEKLKNSDDHLVRCVNLSDRGVHESDRVYRKLDRVEAFYYKYLHDPNSPFDKFFPSRVLEPLKKLRNRLLMRLIPEEEYKFYARSPPKEIIPKLDGWYEAHPDFLEKRMRYVDGEEGGKETEKKTFAARILSCIKP